MQGVEMAKYESNIEGQSSNNEGERAGRAKQQTSNGKFPYCHSERSRGISRC
jgi:hypothetical protein